MQSAQLVAGRRRRGPEEGRRSAARFALLGRRRNRHSAPQLEPRRRADCGLFAGQTCEIELIASGRVAASGAWRFEVTQHGQQLLPVSRWESSCWYTDEDVDYLELEIKLTGGVKLERQIVLAREDRFLLLADAVMSPQRGDLEYRGVLPLAPQVEFRGAAESREGFLVYGRAATADGKSAASARPLAQVLPLGMPEWRAEPSRRRVESDCGGS